MATLKRHQRRRDRNLISLLRLVQRAIALDATLLSDDAQFDLDLYTADVFEAEVAVVHDVREGVFEVCALDGEFVEEAVVDADAAVAGHPDGARVVDVWVYAVVFDVDACVHVGGFAPHAVGGFVDLGMGGVDACGGEESEVCD